MSRLLTWQRRHSRTSGSSSGGKGLQQAGLSRAPALSGPQAEAVGQLTAE